MKKDYIIFSLCVTAAFLLLMAGAWSSPTLEEQQSYYQALTMLGSLLFAFSIVIVAASLGFYSFALYLALFVAMAISLYGPRAGILMLIMTYVVWGVVFSMQILLVHSGSTSALDWFKKRYNKRTFTAEYKVFYPMLWLFYFLLEYIPFRFLGEKDSFIFKPKELFEFMNNRLSE